MQGNRAQLPHKLYIGKLVDHINDSIASKPSLSCPACGKQAVYERWSDESFEYGVGDHSVALNVRIPLCHCRDCDLEFTDYRAEELRHAAVCRHLKLLTPTEIVAIRERHRMSQQAFADVSRFGRASVARWESGSIFQNASADNLLYLLCFTDNIDRLKQRFTQVDVEVPQQAEIRTRFRSLNVDLISHYRSEAASFRLYLDA